MLSDWKREVSLQDYFVSGVLAINATAALKDLIVLVADKNMQATFEALLERDAALGIRRIIDVVPHPAP